MKTALIALTAGLLWGVAELPAQTEEFISPRGPAPQFIPEPVSPRPEIGGIVGAMFKNPQALQLVNPLAPKEFGNGEKFVSRDPNDLSKLEGIIVLSLDW